MLPSCLMMFLLFSTEKGRVSYIIHTETINTNPKGSKSGNNGYFQACVDLRRIVGASWQIVFRQKRARNNQNHSLSLFSTNAWPQNHSFSYDYQMPSKVGFCLDIPKKNFLIPAVSVIFDVFPLVLSKSKEKWKMEEGKEGQVRWQCVQKFCIRSSNYSPLTFWGRISERIAFSELFLYGNIRHKKWRKGKC